MFTHYGFELETLLNWCDSKAARHALHKYFNLYTCITMADIEDFIYWHGEDKEACAGLEKLIDECIYYIKSRDETEDPFGWYSLYR